MITAFNCLFCGNRDPRKVLEHDGMLGYEALVCRVCGAQYDHNGQEAPSDHWCDILGVARKDYVAVNRDRFIAMLTAVKRCLPEDSPCTVDNFIEELKNKEKL